jgi:SOS response regulatory protein OraA/RecX
MKVKNNKTAIETAYTYLASRMRTCAEVEKHLKDRGYAESEILDAINELIGMRYLDDYQYALRYYEYNREKRRGSGRAARELAEKGVDSETIRNAREDYLFSEKVDEYEDALAAAEKELQLNAGGELMPGGEADIPAVPMDEKLAAKIARKLDSRGYERSDIFRVLEELRRRHGNGND